MKGDGNNREYYEWDALHNEIGAYDYKGRHLGALEPINGEFYKPAKKGRKITI